MDHIRLVLFIQALNSFVAGVLGVALPLMMMVKGIDVVTIGLVFASLPIIFQVARMFFATVSDFWGRKLFFVLHALLSVFSGSIYYLARTALEFTFGKVVEGTKDGSLWAVNRAFLLEKSEKKWTVLVYLRATVYVAYGVGSLLAGFLIAWFSYDWTLILCILVGATAVPASLLLVRERKEKFNVTKALRLLDFRRKEKTFRLFLVLFFMMGLSFGFRSGFVFPLFLSVNGFNEELIGVLIGSQIFLAGLFSYLFARKSELRKLILVSGVFYSVILALLGFSVSMYAGVLVVVYGVIEGLLSIGQEGIVSRISRKESYGIDIGLLFMGMHVGDTLSLALAGFLIALWGFLAPFLLSAFIFVIFYAGSYIILKD